MKMAEVSNRKRYWIYDIEIGRALGPGRRGWSVERKPNMKKYWRSFSEHVAWFDAGVNGVVLKKSAKIYVKVHQRSGTAAHVHVVSRREVPEEQLEQWMMIGKRMLENQELPSHLPPRME